MAEQTQGYKPLQDVKTWRGPRLAPLLCLECFRPTVLVPDPDGSYFSGLFRPGPGCPHTVEEIRGDERPENEGD